MSSYIPIASQTLTSSASSVTFTSIPTTLNGKTLRDLVLVAETSVTMYVRFNGDTGSNYEYVNMLGNGSTASSSYPGTDSWFNLGRGLPGVIQIFDFAQTNKHKSILVRSNSSSVSTIAYAGRWASTSAITSITFTLSTYPAGSVFSLYGIEG